MVRRLVHALVIVLTLVVGATAMAVIVSQTAWFKDWLRGYIEREANQYLNGRLSIQRLGGNLFFGVELENIGVSMDGSEVVAVKDLGLDYNVFQLISSGLSVNNIRVNKPVLYLRREGDTWSISRLVKRERQEADREGPGRPIAIDGIDVTDGSVVVDGAVGTSGVALPKRFEHLDAKLSFAYEPVRYSIQITQVSFRGSDPAIALNALSGGVSVRNDTVFVEKLAMKTSESSVTLDGAVEQYLTKPLFKVQLTSDRFSLPEIARLVPALAGIKLQPAFELKMDGPLDRLTVDMNVRSPAGQMAGKVVADLMAPGQSVNGTLAINHLDLAPILNNPAQKSDITGSAVVDARAASFDDLNSLRGSVVLNAPRVVAAGYAAENVKARAGFEGRHVGVDAKAAAYGATATMAGRLVLPDAAAAKAAPIAFDLHGQARNVDLRRMPPGLKVPPAATRVNADYHVVGTAAVGGGASAGRTDLQGDLRFLKSELAGATIAAGSTAGFSLHGRDIGYSADANVSDLDLQRVGQQFKVPSLAADRFKSSINGHIVASGTGTAPEAMELKANGTLSETSLFGGRIQQLAFDAAVAHDSAHVTANGAFADFDPAVASGKPELKGMVGGTLDVDATVDGVSRGVTVDSVQASGKVTLDPSTIGGLSISSANVDADYRNSTGVIRTLDIAGRDVNVKASGTLALNDDGQSNLKVHADSSNLEGIGKIVNQPITGIGSVDGTVTGNRRELQATGKVSGSGVKYGENGALAVTSDFTAKVPQLDAANASVSATTHGTFVTVAGQDINEITARTDYNNKQLSFDATARQPQRSLQAAGAVIIHPDHQEIHLQNLALQSQNVSWKTAPGTQPATIQYAKNAVTVKDLKLVNGDQQITADGSFGRPGDAMKVTLNNIDLATADALMLREPQLSGRLNGSGTITGSTEAPAVKAEFRVNQGGFRQFHYDTFGGTLDYNGKGATVDARLDQNPTTWMTAKGYVPATLFKPAVKADLDARPGPVAPEDRIDVKVDSSPIDLGIVQGFTSAVSKVTGTLEAHVQVTGSAQDPRPDGAVTVQNGAFTVNDTGVSYAHVQGKVDLKGDRVHIDNLAVLDNHDSALTLTGDLAVREGQLGRVHLFVTARDFKVIDNRTGNVRIDSDLEIGGGLRAPRIEGELAVNTGSVNLDEIIALAGDSAYATKEIEYLTPQELKTPAVEPVAPATPARRRRPAPGTSPFDALRMNVHLTVPDDLVLKASDLQTAGSPISLGAVSITLGGDLRATKEGGGPMRLVGTVNTVRGFYDFQGRRFTILRDGTIRFAGTDDLDPLLDIRAERVIQAVTANVNVRGTLKNPEINLSSTPPLEEADILSLIVFNQPVNQLGEGQQISLAQRAQSLATGAAAGKLSQSIGKALNLDEFTINTAPESGGAAQLTVGQQIGQNLYVRVQQGIGDQSQTNFILEYELTKWLRLRTNVLQGSSTQQQLFQRMQGSGVDLLFFFSY